MIRNLLFLLCLLFSIALARDYTGHQVVRANIENEKQLSVVSSWEEIDVWTRDSVLALGWNDILLHKDQVEELNKLQIDYDVIIPSVPDHLAEGQRDLEESRNGMTHDSMLADFFLAYHTYAEYIAFYTNLTTVYSSISKFTASIGTSIQGNNIPVLTIGSGAKKIFINGGQHAREWIAPATVAFIVNQLLTTYSSNSVVKALVDSTTIHVVPLVNPDGYIYTWGGTSQRLWRKNRRANAGGTYGVDLNRNWNEHWGGEGSSGTPSSDTYRGTAPFSEPESTAVSKYVLANKPFAGAIDYHSYSQLILRPYGWTQALPPNDAQAKLVGDTIRARILAVNNVAYTSQPSWALYYTTGSAQDWYYNSTVGGNVRYSYTIELRDTGTYGFQLPANQIKPTGAENWAGFLYFAQTVVPW